MSIEFTVPRLPKLPNQLNRVHWRVIRREKDTWHQEAWAATISLRPTAPLERARLTLIRHSLFEPDPDNLAASWKYLIDGLVQARVIRDDKRENVELDSQWQKANKRAEQHVSVRIVEL